MIVLAVPAISLHAPLWVFYRRMNFVKQRALQAVDPLTSAAVTVGLAIAGAGYWSLVVASCRRQLGGRPGGAPRHALPAGPPLRQGHPSHLRKLLLAAVRRRAGEPGHCRRDRC